MLTSTLYINGAFTNVGIRGATDNRDDVVLRRPRDDERRRYGNVPFGIWTGGNVQRHPIANLTIRDSTTTRSSSTPARRARASTTCT